MPFVTSAATTIMADLTTNNASSDHAASGGGGGEEGIKGEFAVLCCSVPRLYSFAFRSMAVRPIVLLSKSDGYTKRRPAALRRVAAVSPTICFDNACSFACIGAIHLTSIFILLLPYKMQSPSA